MTVTKADNSIFVDEKYGLIKNIYNLPIFAGLPRIHVKMAFGGNYFTAGFNASGAGVTAQAAENSAIGEYIERYSCLHPREKINYSDVLNQIAPTVFNPNADSCIEHYQWMKAIDCIHNSEVGVPVDSVYLTYRSNDKAWITTSTGAACGENLNQCLWKGIAEILERDAFQYIWRRQLPCRRILIEENETLKNFFNKYIKSPYINFKLYQMEMDWEVPAIFGIASFPNGGCVVGASVRKTWLEACEKTLIELSQSIIGYAALILDSKRENFEDYSKIKEYQDHSLLYISDNMTKHLAFLDNGGTFKIPNEHKSDDDKKIAEFFINAVKRIGKAVYFVDVTSCELRSFKWLVGKTLIPNMLDIEPNFIEILKSERLEEIDQNLILQGKRTAEELHNPQPLVPHPFP